MRRSGCADFFTMAACYTRIDTRRRRSTVRAAKAPALTAALVPALALFLVLALALAPRVVLADAGEIALAAGAVFELPAAGGVEALVQRGLTDSLSARAALGGRYGSEGAALDANAGLVLAWDVVAWVPELTVGGGARFEDHRWSPELLATLGLRRYWSLDWAMSVAAGAGLRRAGPYGILTVAIWRRIR